MNERNPYNLAKLAFDNKELDKLLLGKDPYKYMTKFFPGSGDSDVGALIDDGIIPYVRKNKEKEVIDYLDKTLHEICSQYDGLYPIADFILCCALYKKNEGKMPVDIDFGKLLKEMRKSMHRYEVRLKNDFTGDGFRNEGGRYGDLKRLSKITAEKGGLNFSPEERNQDEGIKI